MKTIHDAKYLILLDSTCVVRYFIDLGEAEVTLDELKKSKEYKYSLAKVIEGV